MERATILDSCYRGDLLQSRSAGDVAPGVVRVGEVVRRPPQSNTLAMRAFLSHLEKVGFGALRGFVGSTKATSI